MDFEAVAAQLRKPIGEFGLKIASKMNETNHFMNLATLEHLDIKPEEELLEIGMGNGYFLKDIFAKANNVKYTGCDFSSTMIEEASLLNKQFVENGQAQFIECTSHSLPFKDNFFDKIFTINTLYFWENPLMDLKEIVRVLKVDGEFSIVIRPKFIMETLPFTPFGFTLYNKLDLEKLLIEAGLKNISFSEIDEPVQELNGQLVEMKMLIATVMK